MYTLWSRSEAANDGSSWLLKKGNRPPLVEHDSARFYRAGIPPLPGREECTRHYAATWRSKGGLRYLQRTGTIAAYTRSIVPFCRRDPNSAEQFSFFKQRQYVGSWVTALARNSYTHDSRRATAAAVAVREETEGKWNGYGATGREKGRSRLPGIGVKFSTEYKGPSRAWPKAGFTALLVNLAVCAYIFKTHFDPPGWKGSHCRRQFSIFSLFPSLLSLVPRPLLPFHTSHGHASDRRIREPFQLPRGTGDPFSFFFFLLDPPREERDAPTPPSFLPFYASRRARPSVQLNF